MTTTPIDIMPATPDRPEAAGPLYGLAAQFASAPALIAAAARTRAAGYTRYDTFTPYPLEELEHAMGLGPTAVPLIVLLGALAGGCGAYFLMWYSAVLDYPWLIGGKPLNSWPMFVPITFELTILGAGLAAVVGMLALNRLPQPYHPLFHVDAFARRGSQDRFFLCIEASDPKFEREGTREFLKGCEPMEVFPVAP